MNATTTNIELAFEHRQSAHCESGAIAGLLRHGGFAISEPMAFGLAACMTYAYLPLVKFGGLPLFAYRMPPGSLIRGLTRRLGVAMHMETFRDQARGMQALDEHLAEGRVVGVQASAYWLSYFPPDMRFHFNAHNLIVYGKRGSNYLISDPVIDILVECDEKDLRKARFTRGVMAPRGRLYYPRSIPEQPDLVGAIRKSILITTGRMLYAPVPILGVRGIRVVARKIERLDPAADRYNKQLLGHIVRMQEEIGTGGAGFRFLYASFLQEAAELTDKPELAELAHDLAEVGDQWRLFALNAAKMCKDRMPMDFHLLAEQLRGCADGEAEICRRLRQAVK